MPAEELKAELDTATEILHNLVQKMWKEEKNFPTIGMKSSSSRCQIKGAPEAAKSTMESYCCPLTKFST